MRVDFLQNFNDTCKGILKTRYKNEEAEEEEYEEGGSNGKQEEYIAHERPPKPIRSN